MITHEVKRAISAVLAVAALIAAVGIVIAFGPKMSAGIRSMRTASAVSGDQLPKTPGVWEVYITGAVVRPGVYKVPADSRVNDAVQAAGGLAATADPEAVNLAEHLKDGIHVKIPHREQKKRSDPPPTPPGRAGSPTSPQTGPRGSSKPRGGETLHVKKININRCTADELTTLPGIGGVLAGAIIRYRDDHGPFNSPEDIKRVSGIGRGRYDAIKELISTAD